MDNDELERAFRMVSQAAVPAAEAMAHFQERIFAAFCIPSKYLGRERSVKRKRECPNVSLLGIYRGEERGLGFVACRTVRWFGYSYEVDVTGAEEGSFSFGGEWDGELWASKWEWGKLEDGMDQWQEGSWEPKEAEKKMEHWDPLGLG